MAILTRYGKPVLRADGSPKLDARTGEPVRVAHRHLKTTIAGWGELRITCDTTSEAVAAKYESMVLGLGEAGAHDVLDAIRDKRISLAKVWTLWGAGKGLAAVRAAIAGTHASKLDRVLIAGLVDTFIERGSAKKQRRRAETNEGYRRHMALLIAELGGPEVASLAHLLPAQDEGELDEMRPGAIEAVFTAVYRRRLVDKVSMRECVAKRDATLAAGGTVSQREWRLMRQARTAEISELDDDALEDRATYEDRTAAGSTANSHRLTWRTFVSWAIRAHSAYRTATGGMNVAAMLTPYEKRLTGEPFLTQEQWTLFRAEAVAHDAENPTWIEVDGERVRVDERQPITTVLWDVLKETGGSPFSEVIPSLRLVDFQHDAVTEDGRMLVTIRGTKNEYRATRPVDVPAWLYEDCKAYAAAHGIADDEPLFRGVLGEREDRKRLNRAFRRICKRVEARTGRRDFRKLKPYSLRHTFAVWRVQGVEMDPIDLTELSALMGHSDIAQTSKYAKYRGKAAARPKAARAAAATAGPDTATLEALAGLTPEQLQAVIALAKTLAK